MKQPIEKQRLRILAVDDNPFEMEPLIETLRLASSPFAVEASESATDSATALKKIGSEEYDLVLLDVNFGPSAEALGISILNKVRCSSSLAAVAIIIVTNYDNRGYQQKLVDELADGFLSKSRDATPDRLMAVVRVVRKALRMGIIRRECMVNDGLRVGPEGDIRSRLVGTSACMKKVFQQVVSVAADESSPSACIIGESGTGKSFLARILHKLSSRSQGPFREVAVATFPESLVEAHLFGVENRTFTGVAARAGVIEESDHGVLFIDEICSLTPNAQRILLQALKEKRFRRLGSRNFINVDFQLVCADNRDLESAVNEGRFAIDLYRNIRGVTIHLPPLRERIHDFPSELDAILNYEMLRLARVTDGYNFVFTEAAKDLLLRYSWPGNYSELRSLIGELSLLSVTVVDSEMLNRRFLRSEVLSPGRGSSGSLSYLLEIQDFERATREFKIAFLEHWLKQFDRNVGLTASRIGVNAATAYRILKSRDETLS